MKHTLRKANAWWWSQATNSPRLLGLAAGLLLALAYPPFPFAPLLWLGFWPLLAILERQAVQRPGRRAYLRALGLVYVPLLVWNLICAYWLMLTARYVPAEEVLVSLMGGLMANLANPLLMSIPFLLWLFARRRLPMGWSLPVFICCWLAFEYLHFRWDLSWSWLTLGHGWTYYPQYLQYLEFTGVLGASLHTLVVGMLGFYLSWRVQQNRGLGRKRAGALVGLLLLPLLLWPLLTREGRDLYQSTRSLQVRVVQPNVNPYLKFTGPPVQMVQDFARLAGQDLPPNTDLIILPETAIPTHLLLPNVDEEPLVQPIMQLARKTGAGILSGYHPLRIYPPGETDIPVSAQLLGERGYHAQTYNGASIFGVQPLVVYKKSKLVPFIERAPFMESLAFLRNWQIDIGGGFSNYGLPDSIHNLWLADGTPIAPLICYESEFAEFSAGLVRQGAQLLTVITNDGWWGNSSGYIQHLHLASLRAIEARRALARSANTGISAIFDAQGNISQRLGWEERGTLDARLPLYTAQTFFVRNGDVVGPLAAILAFLFIFILSFRKKWTIRT